MWAAANTYDQYGIPGAGNTGRLSYTGQIILPELGLLDDEARIYNPRIGRFHLTDPIGYANAVTPSIAKACIK